MNEESISRKDKTETAEIAEYQRRLKRLSAEKSQLQLYADLINKLSLARGLDKVSYQLVSLLMETLGGTNVILFYLADGIWYSVDAFRKKSNLGADLDPAIRECLDRKEIAFIDDKIDNQVLEDSKIGDFRQGATWIIPLLVESGFVGAIKMEGMLIVRPEMMDHLRPFINYAALFLKDAIKNYSSLKAAYDHVKEANKALVEEINTRRRAEEELQNSERRFRSTFENAVIGICINAVGGSVLMANPALCKMLGYSHEELLAKNMNVLFHGDDRPKISARIQTLLAGEGDTAFFNSRYLQKSGRPIWTRVGTCLLRDDQGKPLYFISHIEDITSQTLAEERLRSSEIKFRTFFEYVTDYAIVFEPTERGLIIVDLNASACRIHGYTREEMIGQTVDFLDVEPVPPDDWRIQRIMSGEPLSFEVMHVRKDGSFFPADITAKLIEVEGKPYIFSIERDLTERKKIEKDKTTLENQLNQSQKMEAIGNLAGGIAHDFNNILSAVIGYTELAQTEAEGRKEITDYLAEVLKASNRAKELVKQILTFSRKSEHVLKPVRIQSVVSEALKLLRSSIPTTIEIQERIDARMITVLADSTQIHQVLMNLGTNAYQSMRERGGVLGIELKKIQVENEDAMVTHGHLKPGPHVLLICRDNGPGIDPLLVDKIFEPYFTTKKAGEGTGLGLALVHGIVKNHSGHISVMSDTGKGAEFRIYLPCAHQGEENLPALLSRGPLSKGDQRILVIDDEAQICDYLKKRLSKWGYAVTTMTSSVTALEHFATNPGAYDLIITDMTMPKMDGVGLCRGILKVRPEMPIILCTGFNDTVSKEKATALGIRKYLMKPFTGDDLALVIQQTLETGISDEEPRVSSPDPDQTEYL